MPLGIPDREVFKSIPLTSNGVWTGSIQYHVAKRAGPHYDIRLNPPGSSDALSWAVKELPKPGQKTTAVEQPTHEASYMGWGGEIEEGYGAGNVTNIFFDKVEVLESSPDKILFNIYTGQNVDRYMLKRYDNKNWLLYNYSGRVGTEIPDYKPHFKSLNIKDLRTDYEDEIWAPKIDGAHNTIILKPNKRLNVFSYRISKKSQGPIDHTFRTDLYKIRAPKELGTTIVRTELFIPGQDSSVIGGVLNSNVWKSREKQSEVGKLKPIVFDVVKFKGKYVEDKPYEEKLEMLKEITSKIPQLELPPLATTQQEKLKLKDEILAGKNPLTKEGIIIYKKKEPVPYKAKLEEDYDVLITGVFPASPGSKYEGNAIGGFIGIPENAPKTKIKIGSGLSDELRRDAYLNPNKYIGMWAKVSGQMQYGKTGKIRMPIFKGFRYDKYK